MSWCFNGQDKFSSDFWNYLGESLSHHFKMNCHGNSGGMILTRYCFWFHCLVFYVEATVCDTAVGRESSRDIVAGDQYALSTQQATESLEEGRQNREGIKTAGWMGLQIEAHQRKEYVLQSMRRNYQAPSIIKLSNGIEIKAVFNIIFDLIFMAQQLLQCFSLYKIVDNKYSLRQNSI